MIIETITPDAFASLYDAGVTVIDVRTPAEFRGKHVRGAQLLPLDQINLPRFKALLTSCNHVDDQPVYVVCHTSRRAAMAAEKLQAEGCSNLIVVEGGTEALSKTSVPIERQAKASMSLERQVRVAAGFLVLIGVIVGYWGSSLGFALAGLVGLGQIYAGLTNRCGMALMLGRAPWNRA